jgi:hypothetical protein
MKNVLRLLSPALLLCVGMQATPMAPTGMLQIGDSEPTDFTLYAVPNSKLYQLNVNVQSAQFSLSGNATINQDPWIDYGFAIKNFSTSDLFFTILLETPYVGGPYAYASSSHSGSATDGSGLAPANGSVAVVASPGGIHQPFVNGLPFGAIMGGCADSGPAGSSYACGLGNLNGLSISAPANSTLSLLLSGKISAGDTYTFNGLASISAFPNDQVPEPATFGVAGIALGLAAFLRRRMAA